MGSGDCSHALPVIAPVSDFLVDWWCKTSGNDILTYLQDLISHNVKVLVRCCEPSYGIEPLTEAGIKVVVSGNSHVHVRIFYVALIMFSFLKLPGSCIWGWRSSSLWRRAEVGGAGEGGIWGAIGGDLLCGCPLCGWSGKGSCSSRNRSHGARLKISRGSGED